MPWSSGWCRRGDLNSGTANVRCCPLLSVVVRLSWSSAVLARASCRLVTSGIGQFHPVRGQSADNVYSDAEPGQRARRRRVSASLASDVRRAPISSAHSGKSLAARPSPPAVRLPRRNRVTWTRWRRDRCSALADPTTHAIASEDLHARRPLSTERRHSDPNTFRHRSPAPSQARPS